MVTLKLVWWLFKAFLSNRLRSISVGPIFFAKGYTKKTLLALDDHFFSEYTWFFRIQHNRRQLSRQRGRNASSDRQVCSTNKSVELQEWFGIKTEKYWARNFLFDFKPYRQVICVLGRSDWFPANDGLQCPLLPLAGYWQRSLRKDLRFEWERFKIDDALVTLSIKWKLTVGALKVYSVNPTGTVPKNL